MSTAVIDPLSRASGTVAQGGKATAGRNCTLKSRGNKRGTPLRAFPVFVSFLTDCFVCFVRSRRTVSTVSRAVIRPLRTNFATFWITTVVRQTAN